MFTSYLILAFRNFVKERFFSLLNILGLSLGLAVVFLIGLYIVYELGYDRFHPYANRTYRVVSYIEMGPNQGDYNATFSGMGSALVKDLPHAVEAAVRMDEFDGIIFRAGDKIFPEDKVMYADSGFFDFFNFRILAGDTAHMLSKPFQVLLTPFLVERYFGLVGLDSVVGRTIEINRELYTVTGVVEAAPANTHMPYTAIASFTSLPISRDERWRGMNVSLYIRLREGIKPAVVNDAFQGLIKTHMKEYEELSKRGVVIRPYLQTLTSIHLYSDLLGEVEPNSTVSTLYIFGTVGFVTLLLACVNFINLTTARSANRAKEVGVRKVVGSSVRQLIRQFLLEAVLMVVAAALFALFIVAIVQYPFHVITGKPISVLTLLHPLHLSVLVFFVLALGMAAGSYPAFFLSMYDPAQVLRGSMRLGFRSRKLRSGLVITQFALAIILITATFVVEKQLAYMRTQKLGFDQGNVIVVENGDKITNAAAFLETLRALPQVSDAGTGTFKPIGAYDGQPMKAEKAESLLLVNYSYVDEHYLKTLQYEFVQGRNFTAAPEDSLGIVLNESAATAMLGDNAVGQKVNAQEQTYTVIGVVKDFNFLSLRNAVSPVAFFREPTQRYICVRLKPGDPEQSVAAIEAVWKKQYPEVPFVITYLDQTYANLYREEVRLGLILGIFTTFALFIACLGLVGLAVYTAQQRSKEVTVRKVFGASVIQITLLLSREFIRLIVLSCLIAVPVSYYVMNRWLNDFAYRIKVTPWILVQGCIVVLIAGIGAVTIQSVRASLLNPGESLREE